MSLLLPIPLSCLVCSQGVWGEDSGGSLQRRRGEHRSWCAGRPALHLHLRGRRQAQRAEQEDHLHPCHTAVQPNVHLAVGRTHVHTPTRRLHDIVHVLCRVETCNNRTVLSNIEGEDTHTPTQTLLHDHPTCFSQDICCQKAVSLLQVVIKRNSKIDLKHSLRRITALNQLNPTSSAFTCLQSP